MNKNKDRGRLPPFVPMLKDTLASPAWRAMSHGARSLYVSLKARYSSNLHNNGKLFLSQRVAAHEIGSSFEQIARWFRELQHFGFISQTKGGSLGLNGKGTAPHWRLTECGYMKDPPTHDFEKWKGEAFTDVRHKRGSRKQNPVAENRNTLLRKTATLPLRKTATPFGTSVAESRNMVDPPTVAENRNISSLPLPTGFAEPTAEARADVEAPADGPRLVWTTPVLVEVTDPDEAAPTRAAFPDDPDTDDASPMAGTARRLGDGCDRLHRLGPGPSH
jgi:hypothetical protein